MGASVGDFGIVLRWEVLYFQNSTLTKFVANPRFRSEIDRVAADAIAVVVQEFSVALRDSFDAAIYFWPNETVRSTGEIASSPRNVIDTGQLQDSQAVKQITLKRWEIAWEVAYAAIVLLGFQGVGGNSQPGRDWIGYALSNIDLRQVFSEEVRARLR